MDKQTYLKKFSRIVRLKLPKPEADAVLADYNEMFSEYSGENKEIPIQEFGKPAQAAQFLSEPKAYHRWLVLFCALAFCLLLSEFFLLRAKFNHYPTVRMYILLILGCAGSLIWFRPQQGEKQKSPLPQRLLSMLLVLLALVIAVAAIMAGLSLKVWAFIPPGLYGRVAYWALLLAGTVATIFGLFGLVNARLSDRRWCSLYIMGLTILAECVLVLALLVNMSLDTASAGWWVPYVTNLGVMGIAGLIGVGISLC